MPCPICQNRVPGYFESLCEKHFNELPRPSRDKIKEAMERGRKAMEAYFRSIRGRNRSRY